MGETKTIKAKVIHKHETEAGWLKSSYIPGKGEIVFYDAEVDESGATLPTAVEYYNSNGTAVFPLGRKEAITYARQKIGDGVNLVRDLPFCTITEPAEIELISAVEGPLFDISLVGKGRISLKFLSSCYFMYGGRRYAIAKDVTVAALNKSTTSQRLVCTIPEYTTKTATNADGVDITVSAITTSITASNLRFVDATNSTLKSNDIVLLSIANTNTVQQLLIPANLSTKAPYSVDGVTAGKSLKTVYVSSEGTSSGLGTKDSPITLEMALASDAEVILLKPNDNYFLNNCRITNKTNLTIRTDWQEEYDSSLGRAPATIEAGLDAQGNLQDGFIIKFENIQNLVLEDVIFTNSQAYNCFITHCNNFVIRNCEFSHAKDTACLAIYSSNGTIIGCNAHDAGYNTTQPHCDGINLHDCGHTVIIDTIAYDNQDDGISHHDRCVGTIIGGEYYNNGKGGISSPVSGAQVNIYNAYTHDNKYGIYTAGTKDQTDISGECRVHSCIIENNKYAFRAHNYNIYSYNNALNGNTEKLYTIDENTGSILIGLGQLIEMSDTGLYRGEGTESLVTKDSVALSGNSLSLGVLTTAGSKAFQFTQVGMERLDKKIYKVRVGIFDENGIEITDENDEIVPALEELEKLMGSGTLQASIDIALTYDDGDRKFQGLSYYFYNSILITGVDIDNKLITYEIRTNSREGNMLLNTFLAGQVTTAAFQKDENTTVMPNGYITLMHYPECGVFDLGYGATATGNSTIALGYASHTEGSGTEACGNESHAEGYHTYAYTYGHAEGTSTKAYGRTSHAEGKGTSAYGYAAHTEGQGTQAHGSFSHAEGSKTVAGDSSRDADFLYNHSLSEPVAAHAEGIETKAIGRSSHAEGWGTEAIGDNSHAEGDYTYATGYSAHAEGIETEAMGYGSHAEGATTRAGQGFRAYTVTEVISAGKLQVSINTGLLSGDKIVFVGREDDIFTISAVGSNTINIIPGLPDSLKQEAEKGGVLFVKVGETGRGDVQLTANYSHAEGFCTQACGDAQHVSGQYNIPDHNSLVIVGNGRDGSKRSNAYRLDRRGNAWFAGEVYANKGQRLAKFDDVPTAISELNNDVDYLTIRSTTAIKGILSKGDGENSIQQQGSTANDKNSIALGSGTHTGKTLTIGTVVDKDTFTIGNANYYLESGDCIYFPALDEYGIVKAAGSSTVHLEGEISDLASGQVIEVLSPKNEKGQTFSSGLGTIAVGRAQSVRGSYNKSSGKYLDIVGNGCINENGKTVRSNAYTLDWNGNAVYAGEVTAKNGILASKNDIGGALGIRTSSGLEFLTNGDGTCKVVGMGDCIDDYVVIPEYSPDGDRVTSIAQSAFEDCTNLISVILPDSIVSIGQRAFAGCKSLAEIKLSNSLTFIGGYAFADCLSLRKITIPISIDYIEDHAFYYCNIDVYFETDYHTITQDFGDHWADGVNNEYYGYVDSFYRANRKYVSHGDLTTQYYITKETMPNLLDSARDNKILVTQNLLPRKDISSYLVTNVGSGEVKWLYDRKKDHQYLTANARNLLNGAFAIEVVNNGGVDQETPASLTYKVTNHTGNHLCALVAACMVSGIPEDRNVYNVYRYIEVPPYGTTTATRNVSDSEVGGNQSVTLKYSECDYFVFIPE